MTASTKFWGEQFQSYKLPIGTYRLMGEELLAKFRCPSKHSLSVRALHTQPNYSQSRMYQANGTSSHRAFIALGSNVGSRIEMIEKACLEMERANIRIKRTSSLFETAPMYVLDQAPFINGVCEVGYIYIFSGHCLTLPPGRN